MASNLPQGIYSLDYFSGSQAAIYIGDILIDEITSFTFQVSQSKRPLYGYSDQLFRDVAQGQIIVQGSFTINFKESGYLYLALQRYRANITQIEDPNFSFPHETTQGSQSITNNQEAIQNNQNMNTTDRNKALVSIAGALALANNTNGQGNVESASNLTAQFENNIWGPDLNSGGSDRATRRVDQEVINGFDIYLAYGDYQGNQGANYTVYRIENVHILGQGQQINANGEPIQEEYSFFARNLI